MDNLKSSEILASALYSAVSSKLKPKGSNITPPKKKRKPKKK